MDFTILQAGRYKANGAVKYIPMVQGCDTFRLINLNVWAAGSSTNIAESYWQYGFDADSALSTLGSGVKIQKTSNAITLVDTSVTTLGSSVTITNLTGTGTGVGTVTVASGAPAIGTIIRITAYAGGDQIVGQDFSVLTSNGSTTFTIAVPLNLPDYTSTSTYKVVALPQPNSFTPPEWYPANRTIVGYVTSAGVNTIRTSTIHGLTPGQTVRLVTPNISSLAYGIPTLNGVLATVLTAPAAASATDLTNLTTLTVDVPAVGTFTWPLTGTGPYNYAQLVPVGENTAGALIISPNTNILADATFNENGLYLRIGNGAANTAATVGGASGNEMYWVMGKCFSVNNEY